MIALDVDPETDVHHNLTDGRLPFENGAMEAVYSSHCLEHLTPQDARKFFAEARRCLKPGGVFRIVCPDMDLLFDAYERRDSAWFDWCHDGFYAWDGWLRAVGRVAASMVVDRFSDEELAALYKERGRYGLMDRLLEEQATVPAQAVASWPDGHKSWWTQRTLIEALRAEGFSDVYASTREGSRLPALRDGRFFDYSSPNMSLYVEASK